MNRARTILIGTGVGVFALGTLAISASHKTVSAQPSPAATREIPKFEVDPAWPKIPNGWGWARCASAASDEQDNIWILHRPRTVSPA